MSKRTNRFSFEIRERAVRMVLDHEKDYTSRWAAIQSIAPKIGCSGHTLNGFVARIRFLLLIIPIVYFFL